MGDRGWWVGERLLDRLTGGKGVGGVVNPYRIQSRFVVGRRGRELRAQARQFDAQLDLADRGGPFLRDRIIERALAHEAEAGLLLKVEPDAWPPGLLAEGQLNADFSVDGATYSPREVDPERDIERPSPEAFGPLDGVPLGPAFLASVTDSVMRRQPAWVLALQDGAWVQLRLLSSETGHPLHPHGQAPDPCG